MMKNLPAIQETWGRSLGGEDTLEKGITTHFSILAWWIPWTEEPSRLQSMGSQRVRHDWVTNTFTFFMKEKGGNDYLMKKKVKVKLLSRIRLFATPWTVAHQAPPSMGFSRQEYWSGLPFIKSLGFLRLLGFLLRLWDLLEQELSLSSSCPLTLLQD